MIVKYLDLKTGKTAQDNGISVHNLIHGNYTCDCNRKIAFDGCTQDILLLMLILK